MNPLRKRIWKEEVDGLFISQPTHRGRKPGGDLLGGVSALQETDLTGPVFIFKLLPSVISTKARLPLPGVLVPLSLMVV